MNGITSRGKVKNIVQIQDLVKRFGEVVAVDHISLEVFAGEFFSILGPSGCGKTTLLRLIAGLEQPHSGEIYLEGKPTNGIPAYRRNVNTVFQNYALFPHMNVYENIAFGLKMKRASKGDMDSRILEALDLVGLPGLGSRKSKQLSGGQQQRIALARALVNEPPVLLLDEPLGALDLKLRKQMQMELKSLQRKLGITFIYVTHDQEEALTMSDRIAVMRLGKIEQLGEPSRIYEKPATEFVANFIGTSNVFSGDLKRDDGLLLTMTTPDGYEIKAISDDVSLPETATFMVRPERTQITLDKPEEDLNILPGTIQEIIYLGTVIQFIVSSNDTRLVVLEKNYRGHQQLSVDQDVFVSWDISSTIMLSGR